jgi:hypothetical protein
MSYFEDLTFYSYCQSRDGVRGFEVNVGWLDAGHPFPTAVPSDELLESLWRFSAIRICQMRGFHPCDFCHGEFAMIQRHKSEYQAFGSAEIRAFSPSGLAYAAPNLIYHYVAAHGYAPPAEFVKALREGPQPQSEAYLQKLDHLGRNWRRVTPYDAEEARRVSAGISCSPERSNT